MATKKMLTEDKAEATYAVKIVVIGPTDPWPTELPDGTLIIRADTPPTP
jgi:hypothetical protein